MQEWFVVEIRCADPAGMCGCGGERFLGPEALPSVSHQAAMLASAALARDFGTLWLARFCRGPAGRCRPEVQPRRAPPGRALDARIQYESLLAARWVERWRGGQRPFTL